MSIILFIIILALLILVHELGHFIAAKKSGVRVDEFGIGFPPRIFSKKYGETVYSLNLFPVGGFVKIFGENPDKESTEGTDSKRSLVHKSKLIQAWVISAGVIFNLLLAWVLVSGGLMFGMPFSVDDSAYGARVQNPKLTITQVMSKSPAEVAGIKGGDHIVGLVSGTQKLQNPTISATQKFISEHDELELTYVRGGETILTMVRPRDGIVGGRRAIGISMDMVGTLTLNPIEALYAGALTTASLTGATVLGIFDFFHQALIGKGDLSQVSGPVGIVGIVGDASALGFAHIISLMAIISINLAVLNLLPLPALDGGRLFFILIEIIKRSPINPNITNTANGIGFILLILLMVVVTYHDIVKLLVG